ncbi:hypothetical protein [Dysgonomonas sp. ZJ709]|uniref:hypothetical protein n=1 Tax=Dysgonomonas sp. ZJ709 TaxID=2709797 RepID=UPI0013EC4286|nr:hypothetical protein [Dysgonomonas sp. ZJ709]
MSRDAFYKQLENISESGRGLANVLESYFFTGNFEHQIGLISNAIQEIVNKGSDDTDQSLDNQFGYTNRYIRESIYDLTELQKFLTRLHIVYADYKKQTELLDKC